MTPEQELEYNQLQSCLHINLHGLHEDAQGQPELAFRAGELAAELKAAAKRAKLNYEEVAASVEMEVRSGPEDFGLKKVTESTIASVVTKHPDVLSARKAQIEAERDADLAAALANAFEHRRSMLKSEVELYVNNYWGDVEVKERDMRRNETASRVKAAEDKEAEIEAKRRERRGVKRRRKGVTE